MSTRFDNVLEQLASKLSPEELEALKDASPLKSERDEAIRKAQETAAENQRLREATLRRTWADIGAVGDPTRLNLADVDVTNEDALRAYASEAGFLVSKPDVPAEELNAHQRIASASVDGGTPKVADEVLNKLRRQPMSEAEFWATAERAGLATNAGSAASTWLP